MDQRLCSFVYLEHLFNYLLRLFFNLMSLYFHITFRVFRTTARVKSFSNVYLLLTGLLIGRLMLLLSEHRLFPYN
jgi:hypothetical protein